jgi:hypothetical protein
MILKEQQFISNLTPNWLIVTELARVNAERFQDVFSMDILEESMLKGKRIPFNGRNVQITMACLQANFDGAHGIVRLHQEGVLPGHEGEFEVFFPFAGSSGTMHILSDEHKIDDDFPLIPPISIEQGLMAKTELAVATDRKSHTDLFVVNVTVDDQVWQVDGIEDPPGGWHTTDYGNNGVLMGVAMKYKYV